MATQPKQVVLREFNMPGTFAEAVTANRVCYYSAAGALSIATSAANMPAGVTERDFASGDVGEVVTKKVMRCIAGGSITAGDLVVATTGGAVVKAGNSEPIVGRALSTQTTTGAYVEVELLIGSYSPAAYV